MSAVDELGVSFPCWPRETLERHSISHADDVALERGLTPGDGPVDRLVVNMLRHEFTRYDATQTVAAHRAACEAIAARYEWLRPECERQIRQRERAERDERSALLAAEAQEAAARKWQQDRVSESRAAIDALTVGMAVNATVKGHSRKATITKVGRSRVTVAFRLKSGAERSPLVYAMGCATNMSRKQLRRIGEPVVAAGPGGVRVRTRLHLTEEEAAAIGEVGQYLGSVYLRELTHRIALGQLDRKAHGIWRAERKQAVTGVASSRWAGAITRAVEDQYQLGMRALSAHVADLGSAIAVLEARCALRPGETCVPAQDVAGGPRRRSLRAVRGYRTAAERFSKTRRLAALRDRLAGAQAAFAAGRPSITVGGNRLWRTRQHLDAAEMSELRWRGRWDAARMFLTADGESGKAGGNETIRVDESGHLRVKVPAALVGRFGTHLHIVAPVAFNHRG